MGQRQSLPAAGALGDFLGIREVTSDRLMMLFMLNVAVGSAVILWRQKQLENAAKPVQTTKHPKDTK
jgi:hypothetical protein